MSNRKNMVDEGFECISVIFRLADKDMYNAVYTDFQKKVAKTFASYSNHDAVEYAKKLPLGYDAVFRFAVHLKKEGGKFVFIDDIGSLYDFNRWNEKSAAEFLPLFNAFYTDAKYGEFFIANTPLFEEVSEKFFAEVYSKVNLEWFSKYANPSNMRCIYAFSSRCSYAATVNDKFVYCAVGYDGTETTIVHEYCHHFANPIAEDWYENNPQFKKWCDDSVDREKMPYYGSGLPMAYEYVTRACETLYMVHQGMNLAEKLARLRDSEREPFPYIENVYEMVLKL